ncbi:MAG: mechanosensitive ion channel family protein [Acidimicrobiales bacterium]
MLAQDAVDEGLDIVDSLQTGITDFFSQLFGFLPNLIGFLAILFIGWFVARFVTRLVRRLFKAINLDHYLDRAGIGGPLERAGYADSGRFVAKLFYYMVMLIVLKLAFGALDIDALNEPFDQLITWIPKALVALVLIVIGGIVANVVKELVAGVTAGQSYSGIATTIAGIAVWMIFGLAALDQAQIAGDLVDTLTTAVFASLSAILIIKFGVGGIWAARDRFWPGVYDSIADSTKTPPQAQG